MDQQVPKPISPRDQQLTIIRNLAQQLPQALDPDLAYDEIRRLMFSKRARQLGLKFTPDTENRLADAWVQAHINRVQRLHDGFAAAERPEITRRQIDESLTALGKDAQRALQTVSVESREELTTRLDAIAAQAAEVKRLAMEEARQKGLIRDTRNAFLIMKGSSLTLFGIASPDRRLNEVQKAVDAAGGDYRVLIDPLMKEKIPSGADETEWIKGKVQEQFDSLVERRADALLEYRHPLPMRFYTSPPSERTDIALAHGRGPTSFKSIMLEVHDTHQQTLRINDALRWLMATNYFAGMDEPHERLLARTIEKIEAVGGIQILEPAIGRIGMQPGEWEKLKGKFLTALEPEPVRVDPIRFAVSGTPAADGKFTKRHGPLADLILAL